MSFLDWRHQNWSQHSRQFFTRAKWSGRIASFDLLATLPWMQPRILLAGWAGTTHCQLMVSCSPAITHKSFSAWWSQSLLCPNCRCAGIAPTQVWDLALGPLAWAHLSSLSRSLWILSLPSRWLHHTAWCELAESAFGPTVHVPCKDLHSEAFHNSSSELSYWNNPSLSKE